MRGSLQTDQMLQSRCRLVCVVLYVLLPSMFNAELSLFVCCLMLFRCCGCLLLIHRPSFSLRTCIAHVFSSLLR